MVRAIVCGLLLAVGVYPIQRREANRDESVNIGFSRSFHSAVLDEDRTINIYLPQNYESSHRYKRYPVLYLRDGAKFFHSFTGAVDQLTSDATPRAPEMIVVAIVETDRVRDSSMTHSTKGFTGKDESDYESSGGGAKFLQFLEEELVPYVDRTFSTSSYRIYCGYSFTGLSVMAALLAEKSPFRAYIAIDPSWWWDSYASEREARLALATKKFDRVRLFIATNAESYPTNYFIRSRDVGSFAAMLKAEKVAGMTWSIRKYSDESHHSMPLLAFYDGLSFIFSGHKPTLDELYNAPEKLRQRYAEMSGRLGEKVAPREDLLNFMGYQFLYNFADPKKALRYFNLNAEYYPESPNVWDSLGEAYKVLGNNATAVRMYEKSLSLDPANENARKRLDELKAVVKVGTN